MKILVTGITILLMFGLNLNDNERFVRQYYADGALMAEGWMDSFIKIGYWRNYHPNGNISSKGHYENNLRTDYWYFFYPEGIPKREGHYEDGQMTDWWTYYDVHGKIDFKCQLDDGTKHGYCLKYENGELVSAVKYEHGNRIKEWFSLESFKRENNILSLK